MRINADSRGKCECSITHLLIVLSTHVSVDFAYHNHQFCVYVDLVFSCDSVYTSECES